MGSGDRLYPGFGNRNFARTRRWSEARSALATTRAESSSQRLEL